ncbi:hypothetical protein ACQJBY_059367 [Aegilops geniculata]
MSNYEKILSISLGPLHAQAKLFFSTHRNTLHPLPTRNALGGGADQGVKFPPPSPRRRQGSSPSQPPPDLSDACSPVLIPRQLILDPQTHLHLYSSMHRNPSCILCSPGLQSILFEFVALFLDVVAHYIVVYLRFSLTSPDCSVRRKDAQRINAVTEPQNDDVSSPISVTVQDSSRSTLADATLTSRISIQKFCCVISQFSNFKHGLVTETGFGGLMHLKITHKLNLKFSSSLMFGVDPDECVLELDQSRRIPITDQDVNNVLGLSQGSRIIPPGHSDLYEVCIEFSRLASSISTKGVHSLKAAELILSKPLDETSSKVECECFKIAFVIFSVGHVLNPCAKHDYTSVDYWAALVVPSEMNSYNWCRLVKDSLMKGVRKIKSDIANCNTTNHIVGCHLLLQIFM